MLQVEGVVVGDIDTNCYLVFDEDEKEMIVIDPGAEAEKILESIKKHDCRVKNIINTHYHYDHVLANDKLREKTGAKILISEAEKEFVDFSVDGYLQEGDVIEIGKNKLKVIITPGHSAGSICLVGEDFIFTGDTLFADGYGRTDLAGGSEEKIEKSLRRINELIKPGMKVYPGHGDSFEKGHFD